MSSNKYCPSKAKYILLEYNQRYCKTHALKHSNIEMNTDYHTIEDVPNLELLDAQGLRVTDVMMTEILSDLDHMHNYRITLISKQKNLIGQEMLVADFDDLSNKYLLRVCKKPKHIDQSIATSSSYASLAHRADEPICIPILSYEREGHGLCLVRGWKYQHWYYEMTKVSYPVSLDDHRSLVVSLVNLIERMHCCRVVRGAIELRYLVQLRDEDVSSVVFDTLRNTMLWEGRHGRTVDCGAPIDSDIVFDSLTCARRMNEKLHPCRYDDYESLLYFALQLCGTQLSWCGADSGGDISIEKNKFLQEQSTQHTAASNICKLILNAHFDDRPNYDKLREYFSALMP